MLRPFVDDSFFAAVHACAKICQQHKLGIDHVPETFHILLTFPSFVIALFETAVFPFSIQPEKRIYQLLFLRAGFTFFNSRAAKIEWPDPEKYISVEECRRRIDMAPRDKVTLGMLWSAHFQDTCAAFGMETALMNMIANPEIYEAVDAKIMEFYLKANEIFFEATKGKLHAVLIGNDMGSQRGLMLSPDMVRRFIIPGCKKLVEQAHSYGVKVIYHSCGSIVDVIPDLIAAGVDVIHPIQALAAGMEPWNLKEKFGNQVSFCGGVDTQELLVHGSPDDVRAKVRELREIFPTGLVISPSHEAIMPDVPPENIHALFEEATKIYG